MKQMKIGNVLGFTLGFLCCLSMGGVNTEAAYTYRFHHEPLDGPDYFSGIITVSAKLKGSRDGEAIAGFLTYNGCEITEMDVLNGFQGKGVDFSLLDNVSEKLIVPCRHISIDPKSFIAFPEEDSDSIFPNKLKNFIDFLRDAGFSEITEIRKTHEGKGQITRKLMQRSTLTDPNSLIKNKKHKKCS